MKGNAAIMLGENIDLAAYLSSFSLYSKTEYTSICGVEIPKYSAEYWTSKQRQAASIHEVSYRACYKPQLPRFFISLLTKEGDIVYDPFSGRGTTIIEAGLLGRNVVANDVNPLSSILAKPRFSIPDVTEVEARLAEILYDNEAKADIDLSMFYHPSTEAEIISLKNYLLERKANGKEDDVDSWIRMIATNRLTGHSVGFFSVYTLPPNQAVSSQRQLKINQQRNQIPEYRATKAIILKKTKTLLQRLSQGEIKNLHNAGKQALFLNYDARLTRDIENESVQLTVTSPPFLDIVQYSSDNWLRCWFNGLDAEKISASITMSKTIADWAIVMEDVFKELFRITRPGGWVAFEVGEVRKGTIKLEEYVVPIGINAGFECKGIMINTQNFTKTSNIWGVSNNNTGTNTNRIALFRK